MDPQGAQLPHRVQATDARTIFALRQHAPNMPDNL